MGGWGVGTLMYQPQSMLMPHTTYPSQPQSKVNQSSKRLLVQPVLSTHTKYNMPQLSTPEPLSEVLPMEVMLLEVCPWRTCRSNCRRRCSSYCRRLGLNNKCN